MRRSYVIGMVVSLLAALPGCGDSWNSLNQMEKNVQNEVADALAIVQNEATAKFVVVELGEKIKNKWKAVKARKDKYLKSQFLNSIHEKIKQIRSSDPDMSMDQVIERLKSEEPPIKADKIKEVKALLWLTSDADHRKEVIAIGQRTERELARIASLPEEPANEAPTQANPMMMKSGGGSYLQQVLGLPKTVLQ